MSQSRSLPSATAPSNSGARAHTRAYTKQLAELEPSLSLPIRQPEISPSFIHLLHPSTPPPSGHKHDRPHYIGSDTSSDDDENDEEFAFSAVDQPQVSDSDFQIPSITGGSVHHPLSHSIVISNPSSTVDSTSFFEPRHPPHHLPIHPQSSPLPSPAGHLSLFKTTVDWWHRTRFHPYLSPHYVSQFWGQLPGYPHHETPSLTHAGALPR